MCNSGTAGAATLDPARCRVLVMCIVLKTKGAAVHAMWCNTDPVSQSRGGCSSVGVSMVSGVFDGGKTSNTRMTH